MKLRVVTAPCGAEQAPPYLQGSALGQWFPGQSTGQAPLRVHLPGVLVEVHAAISRAVNLL